MNTSRIYSNRNEFIRPVLAGLLGNLAIATLKLGLASLGSSRLVLMDGLFSFMVVAAFLIPWQAQVLEKKCADTRYPYGLGKVLFISMAMVGFLGLVISIHMLYYSLVVMARLRMFGLYTSAMMVTIISIITNEVLFRYLKEKSKKFLEHNADYVCPLQPYRCLDIVLCPATFNSCFSRCDIP